LVRCGICGAELSKGAKFCPSCGTPVGRVVREELSVSSEDLIKKMKKLIHEENVTRIIVRGEAGKTHRRLSLPCPLLS